MLNHYLRVALRSLWKNKAFSSINIIGLTVGLTCCLLMTLYIQHELNYDQFQAKGDRIARVIMEYSFSGTVNKGNYTSTKVAPSFKKNFPEVESAVRMGQWKRIVQYDEKLFREDRFLYADSTFFDLFSFKLIEGNEKQALSGPNNVVLTASTALKYFGSRSPIGKTIKIGSEGTIYQVTGIIENCPSESQIKFDFLASFSSLGANQEETYWDANYTTYLLVKNEAAISSLQAKIPGFMKREMSGQLNSTDYVTYHLEPFKKIHLYSTYSGFEPNNSIIYIYIIGAVAILILAIGCFTYINLSTARSMERAKEVGIRKVAGALKKQIFRQFIGESLLLSIFSLFLSIAIAILLLPSFNELAERRLSVSSIFSPLIIGLLLLTVLCIGFFAGSYPALILSGFQPVKVLKGAFKNTASGLWLRKSLIVFQFVISVFLIVSTFIIQSQLRYIQNKKLGFDREHIIVLPSDQSMLPGLDVLKAEFKSRGEVLHVTGAGNDPTNIVGGYNMRRADMPEEEQLSVNGNRVDEEFIRTTGIHIIAGTDFAKQDIKDVLDDEPSKRIYHFIINESAAKTLGWKPGEAIGKKMFLGNHRAGTVKAVVQDFHFSSMHNPIKPLVLFTEPGANVLLVKISGKNIRRTISFLENKWKTFAPNRPFEYHFLDEDYNKLYSTEIRLGQILNIFAAIAVLLACLGLFGLSAYAIQLRTKEIGIRKLLGASLPAVVTLLSKDFLKLVLIATLIAFPLGWWAMNKWLQDFNYRINISAWIFFVAGMMALLIALITVSFQAIKAALANPVKSLRNE